MSPRLPAVALLAAATMAAPLAAGIRFREVSDAWGLDFQHHHGGSGERYMVETMVGGVVVFDYDLDGDPDVLFVDGGKLPGYQGEEPRSRLFRNEGGGRFVDRTTAAGIAVEGYGCGGSAADYDGDGDPDLYVTAFGPNRLFRNEGDGTFTEVGAAAGVDDPLWSASAAFGDADRDGDLDLYVANYVDFTVATHKFCGDEKRNLQGYCHPGAYEGLPDRYYRNRGDGTFEDATREAGLQGAEEAGLGVIFADLDGDGWLDLYVANDADPNFLFRNRGDGTFEDLSLLSGAAYSDTGSPEAGMGVDAGDVDGDGLLDVVVSNFELETNALYKNLGGNVFLDARFVTNVAEATLPDLGFGLALADFDQDVDLDLVVANGHILDNAEEHNKNSRFAQRNRVLENLGGGRFRSAPDDGLDLVRPSRGLATGDFDGDGDLDLVISNSNQRAEAYENLGADGRFLLIDLDGTDANRLAVGARLDLQATGPVQLREARTASSYLSQNAATLHFGLGAAERAERLIVRWPRGARRAYLHLPADHRLRLYE